MVRERRWPDRQTVIENAQNGILDDTMCAVDIYDLEDWEISGDPAPNESEPRVQEPKRQPRRSA